MKLRLLLLSCTLSLAACVNDGNKLEQLRFTTATNLNVARSDAQTVYMCFPDRPILIGQFTDGSLGEFTQRVDVKYTSSDETKLIVSTGNNVLIPGTTTYYARGYIVPVAVTNGSGTDVPVTITAEFAGLRTSTQVVIHDSGTPVISTYLPGSSEAYLAPGTSLALKATTLRDNGQLVDITQSGTWSFDPEIDSTATIVSAGTNAGIIVAKVPTASAPAAIPVPATTSAKFSLPACPSLVVAPQAVNIEEPSAIVSTRQFPGLPLLRSLTPQLATTDQVTTTAQFAGGQEQDVTYMVSITVTPSDAKNVVPIGSLLTAGDEFTTVTPPAVPTVIPPVAVKVSLATQQGGVAANVENNLGGETVGTIIANLQSLVVTDDTLTTLYDVNTGPEVDAFGNVQLRALGRFDDPDDGSATLIERDITRHMSATGWSVGDTSVLFAGNTFGSSIVPDGRIVSLKDEPGCVTVTANTGLADPASSTSGATIQAFAQVRVKASDGTVPAAGCTPTTTPTS